MLLSLQGIAALRTVSYHQAAPHHQASPHRASPHQAAIQRQAAARSVFLPLLAAFLVKSLPATAAPTIAAPRTAAPAANGPLRFDVDFSRWRDQPLVKDKFGVYQTPFLTLHNLERAVALLPEAGVHDLRYELAWGKPDALDFKQADLHPDFTMVDRLSAALREYDITPLLAMGYCPNPLKSRTEWAAWKDLPDNLDHWQTITRAYAEHLRVNDALTGPFYEIWNEPDLSLGGNKVFFTGSPADYARLYAHAAPGIQDADGDSLVGGPAIAWQTEYFRAMLGTGAPLDFASIHSYDNYAVQLGLMRSAIEASADHRLRTTLPVFLTEYASYKSFSTDGPNSRYEAAARFFQDVNGLLRETDTPKVYWAQWVDDSLGCLTSSFKKKALFNAFKIYGTMLPVDRCPVTPDGAGGIGVMAATDDRHAGVVLWNENGVAAGVTVNSHGLPFARGTLELYRIDSQHASYLDNPSSEDLEVLSTAPVEANGAVWTGTIPAHSVVFLRLKDGSGASVLSPKRVGRYVRSHYHFPDRTADSYADFDPRTSIARLGTGSRDHSLAQIGVVLDDPSNRIQVQVRKEGPFQRLDESSTFGMRVDYPDHLGRYVDSLMLYGASLYSRRGAAKFYWGTGHPATHARSIPELSNGQPFVLDIDRLSPRSWNRRRVILTFILRDAGAGSRARFILTPAS